MNFFIFRTFAAATCFIMPYYISSLKKVQLFFFSWEACNFSIRFLRDLPLFHGSTTLLASYPGGNIFWRGSRTFWVDLWLFMGLFCLYGVKTHSHVATDRDILTAPQLSYTKAIHFALWFSMCASIASIALQT